MHPLLNAPSRRPHQACARRVAKFAATVVGCVAVLGIAPLAQAGSNVGVTVEVNQPGFYGRVIVGSTPPPVIYPQPVIIVPGPVAVQQRPIYLRVPPGHEREWAKHCERYRACGQPVYFVRGDDDHEHEEHHGRGHGYGHEREHHRGGEDRRDDYRSDDRGDEHRGDHGEGRGHGH